MRAPVLLSSLLALVTLAACGSGPEPVEVAGRGVVTVDREAPEGLPLLERPTWTVGDRFVFERGGQVRIAVRVTETSDAGYVIEDEGNGVQLVLDPDLGELGERIPDNPAIARDRDPVDARFQWPLWDGKRWTCHYVQRGTSTNGVPILATYSCDGMETVTVPAGTFEAIRIWRRTRPAVEGRFLDAHDLLWYAPEVGWFVRRLENGVLIELIEYDRQAAK